MRIIDLILQGLPTYSFEFFPPKTSHGEQSLFKAVRAIEEVKPGFVSVTCGAGGAGERNTVGWAKRIRQETNLEPMVHMTCLGVSQQGLDSTLQELADSNLTNVLALRGDPPSGEVAPSFCQYANELVEYIRKSSPDLCIAAACYPEVHTSASSQLVDLEHLKAKADAGVDFFITQLFFDNSCYFDFVGRARSMGITQPIIPGIMPIQNVEQIKKFTTMCGASIPSPLMKLLDQYQSFPQAVFYIGVAHAISQAQELVMSGVPGVHFYTLNKSPAAKLALKALAQAGLHTLEGED